MAFKILLLFSLIIAGHSYRILGLFPHPASSHVNVFYPLMKGLALKGHEVTFVSHYKFPDKIPTLQQLQIEKSEEDLVGFVDMSYLNGARWQMYLNNVFLAYLGTLACKNLATPTMQKLLNSNEHYDIVVMEFFNTDCYAPFAYKFNAHLVGLSSCTIMHWTNERFGNIYNPAYIPISHMDYSDQITFLQRVEGTISVLLHELMYNYILRWNDENIAREYFKEDFPPLTDIVHNASVFLINGHFSLTLPRPLVPQIVDVGGIHVGEVKKLPKVGTIICVCSM